MTAAVAAAEGKWPDNSLSPTKAHFVYSKFAAAAAGWNPEELSNPLRPPLPPSAARSTKSPPLCAVIGCRRRCRCRRRRR